MVGTRLYLCSPWNNFIYFLSKIMKSRRVTKQTKFNCLCLDAIRIISDHFYGTFSSPHHHQYFTQSFSRLWFVIRNKVSFEASSYSQTSHAISYSIQIRVFKKVKNITWHFAEPPLPLSVTDLFWMVPYIYIIKKSQSII